MKCIMRPVARRDGTPDVEVIRVSDEVARIRVNTGKWMYSCKQLWKLKGRCREHRKEKSNDGF